MGEGEGTDGRRASEQGTRGPEGDSALSREYLSWVELQLGCVWSHTKRCWPEFEFKSFECPCPFRRAIFFFFFFLHRFTHTHTHIQRFPFIHRWAQLLNYIQQNVTFPNNFIFHRRALITKVERFDQLLSKSSLASSLSHSRTHTILLSKDTTRP